MLFQGFCPLNMELSGPRGPAGASKLVSGSAGDVPPQPVSCLGLACEASTGTLARGCKGVQLSSLPSSKCLESHATVPVHTLRTYSRPGTMAN